MLTDCETLIDPLVDDDTLKLSNGETFREEFVEREKTECDIFGDTLVEGETLKLTDCEALID